MKGIQPDRARWYGIAVTDETDTTETAESTPAPRRNWARLALIAAGGVVVAIVVIVIVRVLLATPHPTLGETQARDLQPGSCVAEEAADLASYTVVDCGAGHPQQVFGIMDMRTDSDIYTEFDTMRAYADEICARYLEYGLFVKAGIRNDVYVAKSLAMPTEQEFTDGERTALCAIAALDGSALTTDLYQRMP